MSSGDVYEITEGGLARRIERALHVTRGDRYDWIRRAIAYAAIAYLPLLIAAAVTRLATGSWTPDIVRYETHVRALVTIPLLIFAERVVDNRARDESDYLYASGLASQAPDACRAAITRTLALRDLSAPEGLLMVFSVGSCFVDVTFIEEPAIGGWAAVPLFAVFRFLLLRWMWRWALWTLLLWRLARAPLALHPTHPDRLGGLAPLFGPSQAMGCFAAALSTVLAATWGDQIAHTGIPVSAFQAPAILFVLAIVAFALAPGVVFVTALYRLRREGTCRYGAFALRFTRAFEARWFDAGGGEALGAPDISSLADLGGSFAVVPEIRIYVWSRRAVLVVGGAAILPLALVAMIALGVHETFLRIVSGIT